MIDLHEENEFVDYYALLEVPNDADEGVLRKRIFDLYDEARHNLEHRSHRKRFYYVSLYETHLARARHFLLDANRRPRYDACLRAYEAGQPFDYRSLFDKPTASTKSAPPAAVVNPALVTPAVSTPAAVVVTEPTAAEPAAAVAEPAAAEPIAPPTPEASDTEAPAAEVAARGEPAAANELSPAEAAIKAIAAKAVAAQAATRPAPAVPDAQPDTPSRVQSEVIRSGPPPEPERNEGADRLEKLLRMPTLDPQQVGRRRDFQRRELIGVELKAQGRFASLCTYGFLLVFGSIFLWRLEESLLNPKDGTLSATDIVVLLTTGAVLCGVAYLGGWYASRMTRRHIIAKLSRMSYDQLLRHCRN